MFNFLLLIFVLWVTVRLIKVVIATPARRAARMTAAKDNYAQRMYGCNYDELPK